MQLHLTQLLTRILGATLIMIGCATAQTADVQFSNPPTIAKPTGYSHVVEVKGPNRTIYIAGQLGYDAAGKQGTDFREQATLVYENLKAAVEASAAKWTISSSLMPSSLTSGCSCLSIARCATSSSMWQRHQQARLWKYQSSPAKARCWRSKRSLFYRRAENVYWDEVASHVAGIGRCPYWAMRARKTAAALKRKRIVVRN